MRRVRVFLGVTGASGARYAARLLESLVGAGCDVGLTVSAAGIQVLERSCTATRRYPRD